MDIMDFMKNAITRGTSVCAERNFNTGKDMKRFEPISQYLDSMGLADPTKEQISSLSKLLTGLPGSPFTKKDIDDFFSEKAKRFIYVPWALLVSNEKGSRSESDENYGKEPFMLSPIVKSDDMLRRGLRSDGTPGKILAMEKYLTTLHPASPDEIEKFASQFIGISKDQRIATGLQFMYTALLLSGAVTDEKKILGISI